MAPAQSHLRNERKWQHSYFSHVVSKFNLLIYVTKNCNVMVICLFRKGMSNVITMLWMIIKSRFNF